MRQRLFADEREMGKGAGLERQRVRVPAIQLAELLKELAQLEAQPAGKPDPLDVSLLDPEPASTRFFPMGVSGVLERSDFGAGAVVRKEDLGPGERVEIGDERDLELPGKEVVLFPVVLVEMPEEVGVDADLGVERLQGALTAHELLIPGSPACGRLSAGRGGLLRCGAETGEGVVGFGLLAGLGEARHFAAQAVDQSGEARHFRSERIGRFLRRGPGMEGSRSAQRDRDRPQSQRAGCAGPHRGGEYGKHDFVHGLLRYVRSRPSVKRGIRAPATPPTPQGTPRR